MLCESCLNSSQSLIESLMALTVVRLLLFMQPGQPSSPFANEQEIVDMISEIADNPGAMI
jgi:hypothetical protein